MHSPLHSSLNPRNDSRLHDARSSSSIHGTRLRPQASWPTNWAASRAWSSWRSWATRCSSPCSWPCPRSTGFRSRRSPMPPFSSHKRTRAAYGSRHTNQLRSESCQSTPRKRSRQAKKLLENPHRLKKISHFAGWPEHRVRGVRAQAWMPQSRVFRGLLRRPGARSHTRLLRERHHEVRDRPSIGFHTQLRLHQWNPRYEGIRVRMRVRVPACGG